MDPSDLKSAATPADKPVAGIILAAGGSTRMGQPKLLLPWKGKALVRHVAQTAWDAGLSPLIAVTGCNGERVQAALQGLPVRFAENPLWETGQSSSVRAGLQALFEPVRAAIFLLGDQPQIPDAVLRSLVDEYFRTGSKIIAPSVNGQRSNPVLFDRSLFPEMQKLAGDAGGRQIFSRYPVLLIPWENEAYLFDVDTPEDYQKLVRKQ